MKKETPEEFLRRHNMFYEQMPFEALVQSYIDDLRAGLAGEPSSLMTQPTFLRTDAAVHIGESVLALDAGGTNLRAARIRFDNGGRPVVEAFKKRRMPGSNGNTVTAETMFRTMAELSLETAPDAQRACAAFSYPSEYLPDGDARILRLGKETRIDGAEGKLVAAGVEAAMEKLGARSVRRWRVINDSVGSMLGGIASCEREKYSDFIGFILGTGTNACCCVSAESVTKSPETAAMGGTTVVNLESGCFAHLLRGTADFTVDAESDLPGDHLAEKMISGAYYRVLLGKTLALAADEGLLSKKSGERIRALRITSPYIDDFCLDPQGNNPIAAALSDAEERRFAADINTMLLERSARAAAACLCAVMKMRSVPADGITGICADGTMLRLNPVLRGRMEAYMKAYAARHDLGGAEFIFTADATVLGVGWAAATL